MSTTEQSSRNGNLTAVIDALEKRLLDQKNGTAPAPAPQEQATQGWQKSRLITATT
jgi:hypothetical protein